MLAIVTVNKMDDLEEKYAEDIEREGEIFLDGLQNRKSLGELEKEYSKKVKEIRGIYEKSLKKDLNEERDKEIQKAKNKTKSSEKEENEFHVKNLELEENWKERKNIEFTSWGYRTKIKTNNFIQKIIPRYATYIYYRIKRVLSDFFKDARNLMENIWEKISENVLNSLSFVKEGIIKIITDIGKIQNLFKGNGKKDKKGERKEDANKKPENKGK
jgi:hypothetical protein